MRRDNCLLVKNVISECLNKLLIDRDVPGAIQFVKNTISDLLMNRMDLSLLVITKVCLMYYLFIDIILRVKTLSFCTNVSFSTGSDKNRREL